MKLHDENRPKIGYRPALSHGMSIVPPLQIWPLDSGMVEISAMIPILGEGFSAKRYRAEVEIEELSSVLLNFRLNPEDTLNILFGQDAIKPHINQKKPERRERNSSTSRPNPTTPSFLFEDETEEETVS